MSEYSLKILSLFPVPFYTDRRIYFEGDLEEEGIDKALDDLGAERADAVMEAATTLSAVKPELAFHLLQSLDSIGPLIEAGQLDLWTRAVLDLYDSQGLMPARDFIRFGKDHPLFNRYWGKGISLRELGSVLETYLNSLGKEHVSIKESNSHYTDTSFIYLPERLTIFSASDKARLLYKAMATCSYAQIALGTYRLDLSSIAPVADALRQRYSCREEGEVLSDLRRFFGLFPNSDLAADIFGLVETVRIEAWMIHNLPGLYRRLAILKRDILAVRPDILNASEMSNTIDQAARWWLGLKEAKCPRVITDKLKSFFENDSRVEDTARLTSDLYRIFSVLEGPYMPVAALLYSGELRPEEAQRERLRRRESTRVEFRKELEKLICDLGPEEEVRISVPPSGKSSRSGLRSQARQEIPDEININGRAVPVPEALGKVIEEIFEDLGSIPSSYLVVTDEMSGHHFSHLCDVSLGPANLLSENGKGVHVLDEWDYRRNGYRKRWALLRETEISSGEVEGADEILSNYASLVRRIRRQFELMRQEQILLRRQKEGDEIDLDEAVASIADLKAGVHPSDQLFMRLKRDRRDIAAVFLIDLSGSTNGWINRMERDMLLILCEALSVLNDRFAIYGFSGNTRLRCELYRIKALGDNYDKSVKGRIMNIKAYEYTRLGPPIRYLTSLLSDTEARTKLLITLSDGKPDDYDGYRGAYGIEDTRQALIEAKRKGIHPFCITIDKAEHSYIKHMYGDVNYLFIDDISCLPLKVPEIYRKLTS
ncbi:MAG: hypothetical protein COX16_12320 [Deltaproteobacteria bacterium CG23_combo_of_CG06-09_8_20_14_all_51_20]|nr:hypothetical protein [bacterium]NCP08825.1 hypothetical protein [bacterium]OIP41244.1 MAG: hypothetical protein AUK25_06080 [Desulfobacteraceae bacterium CG2_30_51_40]PIP45581.1 MAG: hypothetical protein COX16_12320 [Deltaproteobacteria bacterium CG23_combo_of_CG06-09_8_20_14_all_51_20]